MTNCWVKSSAFVNIFFLLKRFLITKLYQILLIVLSIGIFPILEFLGPWDPENLKWETAPQHLFLIFSK